MRCEGGLACASMGKFLSDYMHIQKYMCTYVCVCVCVVPVCLLVSCI